ncbi:nitrate- and nitrite sensing domain-containing protein [Streptomyces sp. IBSNAI002]|uniref:nitrate- and nitrite sensing domain-containing protein n=1 Tax=Streptomyces sp. IBSNAI002 TaxID=3457500 RepID=UPI003FD4FE05
MDLGFRDGPTGGRRSRGRLATRLVTALGLPAVLCAALVAFQIADALDHADRRQTAQRRTQLVYAVTVAAHALQNERDVAALTPGRRTADVDKYRAATDEALKDFRGKAAAADADKELDERMKPVDKALADLPVLRDKAFTADFGAVASQQAYESILTTMLHLDTVLDFGDEEPMAEGWALHSLSIGKSALSGQRALVSAGLAQGGLKPDEAAAVRELRGVRERAQQEFRNLDLGEDRDRYDATVRADDVTGLLDRVLADPKGVGGVSIQDWHRAATTMLDQIDQVETAAAQRLLDHATAGERTAQRKALAGAAIAVAALLITMTVAATMARTLVTRLRSLRDAALRVAESQLPELVEQISAGGGEPVEVEAAPIDLASRDEIGDVSRAFDAVFREAVKQTAEQAALRTGINAMLVSLARRSQGLVHRQLDAITSLENAERDPKTLAELFRIDHLATRIRRHGDNLLVLAGADPGSSWPAPAPLIDVVRAAAAETEEYTKVRPAVMPEIALRGPAVHDVTHLLAELLENAAQFSGPGQQVQVVAASTPDGRLVVEIRDAGVGIPPDRLEVLNARLEGEHQVELAVSRCMGLYVVGRLAAKRGMRVRLRSGPEGTTALVMLPAELLHTAPAKAAPAPANPGLAAPGPVAPGQAAPGLAAPGPVAPGLAAPGVVGPSLVGPGPVAPGLAAPGVAAQGPAVPGPAAFRRAAPGPAGSRPAAPGLGGPGVGAHGRVAAGSGTSGPAAAGSGTPGPAVPGPADPAPAASRPVPDPEVPSVNRPSPVVRVVPHPAVPGPSQWHTTVPVPGTPPTVLEQPPARDELPVGGTPPVHEPAPEPAPVYEPSRVYSPGPGYEQPPVYQPTPMYEQPPVYQSTPGYEQPPVYQATPGYEQPPVYQSTPVYEQPPVYEPAPGYEQPPVYQPTPMYEQPPAYEPAPVRQQPPVHQQPPVRQSAEVHEQPRVAPSGLPVRVPMSHLRRGSAGAAPADDTTREGGTDAGQLRRQAADFRAGAHRARHPHTYPTKET